MNKVETLPLKLKGRHNRLGESTRGSSGRLISYRAGQRLSSPSTNWNMAQRYHAIKVLAGTEGKMTRYMSMVLLHSI